MRLPRLYSLQNTHYAWVSVIHGTCKNYIFGGRMKQTHVARNKIIIIYGRGGSAGAGYFMRPGKSKPPAVRKWQYQQSIVIRFRFPFEGVISLYDVPCRGTHNVPVQMHHPKHGIIPYIYLS